MKPVNLVSDTATVPSAQMKAFMIDALVGDDVFALDPTTNKLEAYIAELFGHEAAVFCPTGTMSNQIALMVHTERLDEIICEASSHIYQYETGGYAVNGGLAICPIKGDNSKLKPGDILPHIKADFDWLPRTSLLTIENTCNKGGGVVYTLEEMKSLSEFSKEHNLKFHLDGARIFNAIVKLNMAPKAIGELFDSISICLSKGLGAPMGTLLLGSKTFIKKARRYRKVFGGGMRQTGYMAAAGLYALENHVTDLKTDHQRASILAKHIIELPFVESVIEPETNIVIFNLKNDLAPSKFLEDLAKKGISAIHFGGQSIRMVTHRDLDENDIKYTIDILGKLNY